MKSNLAALAVRKASARKKTITSAEVEEKPEIIVPELYEQRREKAIKTKSLNDVREMEAQQRVRELMLETGEKHIGTMGRALEKIGRILDTLEPTEEDLGNFMEIVAAGNSLAKDLGAFNRLGTLPEPTKKDVNETIPHQVNLQVLTGAINPTPQLPEEEHIDI